MTYVEGKRLCSDCAGSEAHGRSDDLRRQMSSYLKRTYGITIEEYEKMHRAQSGRCAICHARHAAQRFYRLVVDHDHTTGEVRGLLCTTCNSALGLLKDDPAIIRKAADYLEATPVSRLLASFGL
jgi:hypothetical protein